MRVEAEVVCVGAKESAHVDRGGELVEGLDFEGFEEARGDAGVLGDLFNAQAALHASVAKGLADSCQRFPVPESGT